MLSAQPLAVSYSAINTYWDCEQAYFYRYVKGYRRRDKLPRLERGSMLHLYLETYYKALKNGVQAAEAHATARQTMTDEYGPVLQEYAAICYGVDDEKNALMFVNMGEAAERIVDRYHLIRGEDDAQRYDVLLVEHKATVSLSPSIVNNGVLDLVTRDRSNGRAALWEHKTVESIPDQDRRLRDLQTMLYSRIGELTQDIQIDEIVWNYLRTKEPTVPRKLVKGGLSRDKSLDTTWQAYIAACYEHGYDPEDYQEERERLLRAEWDHFFPRKHMVVAAQESVLLRDFITAAQRIEEREWQWATGREIPIRSVGYRCDRCEYEQACMAVILNGDDTDVLGMRYTSREQRKALEDGRSSTTTNTAETPSELSTVTAIASPSEADFFLTPIDDFFV